jgi:hypothetical protein
VKLQGDRAGPSESPLRVRSSTHLNCPGFPGKLVTENRHADWSGLTVMVGLLALGRRNVAERFEQAAAVVPRDPPSLEGACSTRLARLPVLDFCLSLDGAAVDGACSE